MLHGFVSLVAGPGRNASLDLPISVIPPPDLSVPKPELQRDLGEQPLTKAMAERKLSPNALVANSSAQLTHKMIARAMKGRRLTKNTAAKVLAAWNKATDSTAELTDLFNYRP